MPNTDRIVIEFDADTEGMLPAIDILQAIGVLDAKTVDQFKKGNATFKERQKALQDVKVAQAAITPEVDKSAKSYDNFGKAITNVSANIAKGTLGEVSKEVFEGVDQAIHESSLEAQKFGDGMAASGAKAETASKSLKSQLRQLKEELSVLESQGKDNTVEFEQMAIKAAKLEDQIGDTATRIRNMADDSRGIKTVLEAVGGIAAGFEVAQGAAALFGDENKELQQTLIKLNAVMAIANGLQQINTLIQKQSFVSTAASAVLRRAEAVSVQLETAAESENIIVKYAAVAAQKALNAAMSISPAGFILTTIIAIAGALVYFTSKSEDATEAQLKFNESQRASLDAMKQQEAGITELSNSKIRQLERDKANAIAEGASLKEIRNIEKQIDKERLDAAQARIEANRNNINIILDDEQGFLKKIQSQKDLLVELERKKAEGAKSYFNQLTQQNVEIDKAIEVTKNFVEIQTSAYAQAKAALTDYNNTLTASTENAKKRQLDEANERINLAKTFADNALLQAKKGTDAELAARIKIIETEKNGQIELAKLSDDSEAQKLANIKNIILKSNEQIRQAQQAFLQQRLEDAKVADQLLLSQSEDASRAELELKKKIIDDELKIELANVDITANAKALKTAEAEKKKQDLDKQFNQKVLQEQINTDKSNLQRRLSITQAGSAEELQIKQDLIEQEADAEKLQASLTIKNKEELAAKIKEIDAKTVREKNDLINAAAQKELQLQKETADAEIALENAKLKNRAVDPNLSASERDAINNQILANQQKLVDNENALNESLHNQGLINEQEYQKNILLIQQHRYEAQTALAQATADQERQIQQSIINETITLAQNVAGALFQIQSDTRQANLEAEIASSEAERDTLLKNKKLTESEKEKINKEAHEREARLKLAAWQAEQDAAAEQAAINGLVAITKTFAEYGFTAAAAIAVAALIAETGLQVAAIESKSPPKFEKGTDYVQRGNNPPGIDTVPALLTEGEGVDTVDVNRDYSPALKKIRRRKIKPSIINKLVDEIPEEFTQRFVNSYTIAKRNKSTDELKTLLNDAGISAHHGFVKKNILSDENNQVLEIMQRTTAYDRLVEQEIANARIALKSVDHPAPRVSPVPVAIPALMNSAVINMPAIRPLSDHEINQIMNVTQEKGHDIDYAKLSKMIAKEISDQMAEHVDDIAWRNRQDLKRGIPITGGIVNVNVVNQQSIDPYRR